MPVPFIQAFPLSQLYYDYEPEFRDISTGIAANTRMIESLHCFQRGIANEQVTSRPGLAHSIFLVFHVGSGVFFWPFLSSRVLPRAGKSIWLEPRQRRGRRFDCIAVDRHYVP